MKRFNVMVNGGRSGGCGGVSDGGGVRGNDMK